MPQPSDPFAAAEALYREARELGDRADVGEARGNADPDLVPAARAAAERARVALAGVAPGPADARPIAIMNHWLRGDETTADESFSALSRQILDRYADAQAAVRVGAETITRLGVLGRLGEEHDPELRRRLFLALEPVWRSIAGDGGAGSAYRTMIGLSARRFTAGRSVVDANARALGWDPASVEPMLLRILEAWRDATAGAGPIEPWDWWYAAGAADRAVSAAVPMDRMLEITRTYHAALGADLDKLEIGFDITAREGRPAVPVAYSTFGGRPRIDGPGAQPWIFATYTAGGLGELTELIHEAGHAIHIAAIRTRPAFADWPDSDAFTEALAELLALDTAEPSWQRRWLGAAATPAESIRGRYADVMLDVCWALLEIRLHAAPDSSPDDVWTELTSSYLGIVEHPELPWWAMRGQLAEEPGYMINYAIGPILAADLRATIRAARGDWTGGDPGWYAWVSERIYRFGLERSSAEVLASVLGRPASSEALLAEIARMG